MKALPALLIAASLTGCAQPPDALNTVPAVYTYPGHAASLQAAIDCGGPYIEWNVEVDHTPWPYRTTRTETMRCLNDGRIVGPYSYRTDGL